MRRWQVAVTGLWLAAGVGLTGCANQRAANGSPGVSDAEGASRASQPAEPRKALTLAPTTQPETSATGPATREASATQPTVISLNRSHWPKVRFQVAPGRTWHYPVYFERTPPSQYPNAGEVINQPTVPARLRAALSGSEPGNWSRYNWRREGVELGWFAWDLVTWPVSAVKRPPWRTTLTPAPAEAAIRGD